MLTAKQGRTKSQAVCGECKQVKQLFALPEFIDENGNYTKPWHCQSCSRKLNTDHQRGRTLDEMRIIGHKNANPMKTFTQEEIDAVAHLYEPPDSQSKVKNVYLPNKKDI